ncbi:MAG: signal peptidase II [Anaeromyxobacter sp.]|nr:signal peptidase II [Anaeromyxobacter sp.]
MTPLAPAEKPSFVRATGQGWKLTLAWVLFAATAVAVLLDWLAPRDVALTASLVSAIVGTLSCVAFWSIRCPSCRRSVGFWTFKQPLRTSGPEALASLRSCPYCQHHGHEGGAPVTPVPASAPTGLGSPALPASRWVVLLLLLGCIGCDQATKRLALALLPEGRRITLLGDVIRLEHARNAGGFLGAGAGLGEGTRGAIFLWGVALVTLVAAGAAFSRRLPARQALGWALVAGGGIGNLIDRAMTGGWVVDFMNVGIGPVRTGIFNVADVAIMAGIGLLLVPGTRTHQPAPAPPGPPAPGP